MMAILTSKGKKVSSRTDEDRGVSCQLDAVDDRCRRPRRDLDPHEAAEKAHNEKNTKKKRERERGRAKGQLDVDEKLKKDGARTLL